jgi:tyrosine-protein kinase Etk/Wzc
MPSIYKSEAKVMVNYQLDNDTAHLLSLYRVHDNSYYDRLSSERLIFKMHSILEPVAKSLMGGEKKAENFADQKRLQEGIDKLKNKINVEREQETNVLLVSCEDQDPRLATTIVDRVVSEYIGQRPTLNRDERAYQFFDEQIKAINQQIDDIKARGMQYQQKEKVVDPDQQANILFQSIAGFDKELTKIRSERIAYESRVQVFREQIAQGQDLSIPTSGASESPSRFFYVNDLKNKLLELELEKTRLSQKYTENHPKIQEIAANIQATKKKREEEIHEILKAEEASIKALRASEEAIASRMNQVVNKISDLSKQNYELGKITVGIKDLESVLSMLIRQREEARIAAKKQENLVQVRLLEPAVVPNKPVKPNRLLFIGLGFILALFVSFGVAFFYEYFDHSVHTVEDAQNCLGLPILAVIPEFATVYPGQSRQKPSTRPMASEKYD